VILVEVVPSVAGGDKPFDAVAAQVCASAAGRVPSAPRSSTARSWSRRIAGARRGLAALCGADEAGEDVDPVHGAASVDPAAVFVFIGQGWQWAGMGEERRRTSAFAARLDACAEAPRARRPRPPAARREPRRARCDRDGGRRRARAAPARAIWGLPTREFLTSSGTALSIGA
jgi:hypothetical protein